MERCGGGTPLPVRHRKGESSLFPADGEGSLTNTVRRSGSLEHGEERAGRGWRHPAGALAGREASPCAPVRPIPGGIRAAGLSPCLQAGRGGAEPRGAARTLAVALALGSGKGDRHPSSPHASSFFPSPSALPNTCIPKSREPLRLRPLRAAPSLKEELGPPFSTKTELPGCGDRGGQGWAGDWHCASLRGCAPPGRPKGRQRPAGLRAALAGLGRSGQEPPSPRPAAPVLLVFHSGGAGRAPAAVGKGKFAVPAGRCEALSVPTRFGRAQPRRGTGQHRRQRTAVTASLPLGGRVPRRGVLCLPLHLPPLSNGKRREEKNIFL